MFHKKVQRLTVLYGSSNELQTNVSQNDTCLTFKGGENVVVQDRVRLLFDNDVGDRGHCNSTRITWLSPLSVDRFDNDSNNNNTKGNVLQPVLSPGFNIYTRDQTVIDFLQSKYSDDKDGSDINRFGPPVETPKYTVFHLGESPGDGISLRELVPSLELGEDYDLDFHWKSDDGDDVQYNIEITDDQVQIDRYRRLSNDETLTIFKELDVSKLEVGAFFLDMQDEDDINLSGFRCLWRESDTEIDKCIKTSLFYKPAFVNWNKEYTTIVPITLETPIGMHPKVQVDLRNVTTPLLPPKLNPEDDNRQCDFYLFAQLPLEIFVDKFQSHPVFVFGEHDLELPEYKLRDKSWGSEVLYTLQPGQLNEITLHSRYLAPAYKPELPYGITNFFPQVFMACDSDTDSVVRNPFYSKSLGFESFFTDNTVFYPLNVTRLEVSIPRAEADSYRVVQLSTLFVVVFSLVYLLLKLFGPLTKPRDISEKKIQ